MTTVRSRRAPPSQRRPPAWVRVLLPPDPQSFLSPQEQCLICTPRHWLVPFMQITRGALSIPTAIVLSIILATFAPGVLWLQVVLWLMTVGHLSYVAYCVLLWRHDKIIVTNKRFLRITGLLTSTVDAMPLSKYTDMTYHRSIPGRVLGYGTLRIESAGQRQSLEHITYVPSPDAVYQATQL